MNALTETSCNKDDSANECHKTTLFRALLLPIAISILILLSYLFWYASTPMGKEPVMDGYYNLALAKEMASGELPERPFFRAPAYSALLAIGYAMGVPDALMPDVARLLNVVAYVAMLIFVGLLTHSIWKSRVAMAVAVLVVGLHPVPHFFAGDPYDIIITTALVAAFTWIGWLIISQHKWRPWLVVGSSLIIGAGCSLRSQLLPLAMLWPIILAGMCYYRERQLTRTMTVAAFAAIGPMLSFLGLGLAHWKVAGEFRMMPWQGPYMLYYGNNPELFTGYIYTQKVYVDTQDATIFPVEAEALELFGRQTGATPPYSIDAVNDYYSKETRRIVLANPLEWAVLPLRKMYALLNNVEQYDNKTWSLQKGLSPVLRWNPLNWGILLLAGVVGAWVLWGRNRKALLWIGLVAGLYVLVSLLTIVNNRYRVPLYPLLGVLAGGLPLAWAHFRVCSCRARYAVVAIVLLMVFITFPKFFGVEGQDTRLADYVLMAQAANQSGDDVEALKWAQLGHEMDSQRPDLKELWLTSSYNLVFAGKRVLSSEEVAAELAMGMDLLVDERQQRKAAVRHVCGVWAWKQGNPTEAAALWVANIHEAQEKKPSVAANDSMGALLLTGMLQEPEAAFSWGNEPESALLDFSRANYRNAFTDEQRALGPYVKGLFERVIE